jgi:hypothetical protein
MNPEKKEMVLCGIVTDITRLPSGLNLRENVTFAIDGAAPLWDEVRLPNLHGWVVGDRVSISIVSAERKSTREAA